MDKARARRLSSELKGTAIAGWTLADLIDYGKSALLFAALKENVSAALKLFDPELVDRYGEEVQRERIDRERALIGKSHPSLVPILDAGSDAGYFMS